MKLRSLLFDQARNPALLLIIFLCCSFLSPSDYDLKLSKVKTVKEYLIVSDGKTIKKPQFVSNMEFYPNGQKKSYFELNASGDTVDFKKYTLGKNQLIESSTNYRQFRKEWSEPLFYQYPSNDKKPTSINSKEGFTCNFTYDKKGNLIDQLFKDDSGDPYDKQAYEYDAKGLIIKITDYKFVNNIAQEIKIVSYRYQFNAKGKVLGRSMYRTPLLTIEKKKVNLKDVVRDTVIHHPEVLQELIIYNEKGERFKKSIYNDGGQTKQFLYGYTYY